MIVLARKNIKPTKYRDLKSPLQIAKSSATKYHCKNERKTWVENLQLFFTYKAYYMTKLASQALMNVKQEI